MMDNQKYRNGITSLTSVIPGDWIPFVLSSSREGLKLRHIHLFSLLSDSYVLSDKVEMFLDMTPEITKDIEDSYFPLTSLDFALHDINDLKEHVPKLPMFDRMPLNLPTIIMGSILQIEKLSMMEFYKKWSPIMERIYLGLRLAEMSYTGSLPGNYYTPPDFNLGSVHSALMDVLIQLMSRFKDYREKSIRAVREDYGIHEVFVTPPFFYELAVKNAAAPEGVIASLRDIWTEFHEIKDLARSLLQASPQEQVKIGKDINQYFEKLVKGNYEGVWGKVVSNILSFFPALLTGNWLKGLETITNNSSKLSDFISAVKLNRQMKVLHKIHVESRDLKSFYEEIRRVYGKIEFSFEEMLSDFHTGFNLPIIEVVNGSLKNKNYKSIIMKSKKRALDQFRSELLDQFKEYK